MLLLGSSLKASHGQLLGSHGQQCQGDSGSCVKISSHLQQSEGGSGAAGCMREIAADQLDADLVCWCCRRGIELRAGVRGRHASAGGSEALMVLSSESTSVAAAGTSGCDAAVVAAAGGIAHGLLLA
tara:strand:+ start:925 stop:1305 length:381 start_codon:yes stop_codon:yes gene_type:complete